MIKVRPFWQVVIYLFLAAGVAAALPGEREGYLGYKALAPRFPITTALLWLLAWLFYLVGRWDTQRGIK